MPRYADETEYSPEEIELWVRLKQHEGTPFFTVKGLSFTYRIVGNELFVDRKEKSITRATVNKAYRKAVEAPEEMTGPKKLGTFGASYLFSIFHALKILPAPAVPTRPTRRSGRSPGRSS